MEAFLNGFIIESRPANLRSSRSRSEVDLTTLTGRHDTYSIEYDTSRWDLDPGVMGDEEFLFTHHDGDIYAMIIAERTPISWKALRNVVVGNVEAVASESSVLAESTIEQDGVRILCMTISATVDGIDFIYHGYSYTGEVGTIQAVTFTSPNLFAEYRDDMEDFLNGLTVLED